MISTWFGKRPTPEKITRASGDMDVRLTFATAGARTLVLVGNLSTPVGIRVGCGAITKRAACAHESERPV
jgi:hypothetical protein